MKNLKKIPVVAALLLSAGVTGAFAQNTAGYDPSWYFAPSVNALNADSTFGGNNGGGAGLRFGKAVAPNWDIQLGTTYSRTNSNGSHYQQNLLGADALYMFSRDKTFRPFLLIGAGYEEDRLSGGTVGQPSGSGYAPYLNAGLGAQFALNNQWSIQTDYRRVHGFLRDNNFGNSNSDNNDYLNVGLTYKFGQGVR